MDYVKILDSHLTFKDDWYSMRNSLGLFLKKNTFSAYILGIGPS